MPRRQNILRKNTTEEYWGLLLSRNWNGRKQSLSDILTRWITWCRNIQDNLLHSYNYIGGHFVRANSAYVFIRHRQHSTVSVLLVALKTARHSQHNICWHRIHSRFFFLYDLDNKVRDEFDLGRRCTVCVGAGGLLKQSSFERSGKTSPKKEKHYKLQMPHIEIESAAAYLISTSINYRSNCLHSVQRGSQQQ